VAISIHGSLFIFMVKYLVYFALDFTRKRLKIKRKIVLCALMAASLLAVVQLRLDCFPFLLHDAIMRTVIMYVIGAIASLVIMGYTVHMFIGGMVSPATEHIVTAIVIGIGAIAIFWMTRDVLKRR